MGKIKFYNSIKFKLIVATFLLIIIPFVFVFLNYTGRISDIFIEKYTSSDMQSVYEASSKIDYLMSDIEAFSNIVLSNKKLLDVLSDEENFNPDDLYSILRDIYASRDDIDGISVAYQGQIYSIGIQKIMTMDQVVEQQTEKYAGKTFWIPTRQQTIKIFSGEFVKEYYTFMRSIIDFNTLENYGTLYIDIEEENLYNEYKSLEVEEGSELMICDSNGRVLSSDFKTKIGTYITYRPYGDEILSSDNTKGIAYFTNAEDEDMVAMYAVIPTSGWILIKTVPTNYLFKEVNQTRDMLLLGGGIYVVAVAIFMGIIIFRMTKPMTNIMNDLGKIERGDLSTRTAITTDDEIGRLGISVNNMVEEMEKLIDQLVQEEKERNEIELEALHAQINPHFLYNTLNTIKWMATIQGVTSVSNAITALSKLLRISINFGNDMIRLKDEIDYVKNYIIIQKLRFNEGFTVAYDIDEDCLNAKIPKLILQPIVENAIIYGTAGENHVDIKVRAYRRGKEMFIEIEDNGAGIEPEKIDKILLKKNEGKRFSKVGLNNVNQRIKHYFGEAYGLKIRSDKDKGTTIIIKLLFEETRSV